MNRNTRLPIDAEKALLMGFAAAALLIHLGAPPLWNIEGRWGSACCEMMRSGDYFRPVVSGSTYYDKPLPPYWLMIGMAHLLGRLDEWALRLPSVLAGLMAVAFTVRAGERWFGRAAGVGAGWMLATTFFFIQWGRQASADMLNLAGVTAAVAWYAERRDLPGFVTHAVFFLILAVACLMKGLIAGVVAGLILLPDLCRDGAWRRHLRPSLAAAIVPAAVVYALPFIGIAAASGEGAAEGISLVFRENVVRYFQPFDHKNPFYIYLLFLPLYLLPWTLFLPSALWRLARSWKDSPVQARNLAIGSILVFVWLSASGSRRPYYLLPILPWVLLLIAEWIHANGEQGAGRRRAARWAAALAAGALVGWFGIAAPHVAANGGLRDFGERVRAAAAARAPWAVWRLVLLNAPSPVTFYCRTEHPVREIEHLLPEEWPALRSAHPHTILITRVRRREEIRPMLGDGIQEIREDAPLPGFLQTGETRGNLLIAYLLSPD
jgi:4-amino-4-deoxy-L-arabinose transferase-like glycosyltransferase